MVTYKTLLTVLSSILSLSTPIHAEEIKKGPEVKVGYTAFETGPNRLLTNVDIGDKLTIGHHGIDESPNFTRGMYYGRHAFDVSIGSELRPAALVVTGPDGFSCTGFGVRNETLLEKLGGYGFLEGFLSPSGIADLTIFYGISFDRSSLECYQETIVGGGTKPAHHSEVQGNLPLGGNYFAFGRMEWNNFKDPKLLGGLSIKLGG